MYITSLSQIVLMLLQFWSRKAKQRALYVYLLIVSIYNYGTYYREIY